MRFPALLAVILLASTTLAGPHFIRNSSDDDDDAIRIFKHANDRWEGAICKGIVTKHKFPNLVAPTSDGGCVRYFQGIDITGVVTEVDLYFKDGIKTACDCVSRCLSSPTNCTNWVFKHTFVPALDSGKRTCTLYSSPNLPTGVTLWYNLTGSVGFELLQAMNNPQVGALAPFTFKNAADTRLDPFGVSGFLSQDQNSNLYC